MAKDTDEIIKGRQKQKLEFPSPHQKVLGKKELQSPMGAFAAVVSCKIILNLFYLPLKELGRSGSDTGLSVSCPCGASG